MWENIKKFWNNDVHVVFTGSGAEFSGIKGKKDLSGIVCVSDDKKAIVLTVGEVYKGTEPFIEVKFLPIKSAYTELEYGCFHSYLRYAISDLVVSFIRPRCFLTKAGGSFSPSEKKFLDELFKTVVVREVNFWDSSKRTFLPK